MKTNPKESFRKEAWGDLEGKIARGPVMLGAVGERSFQNDAHATHSGRCLGGGLSS